MLQLLKESQRTRALWDRWWWDGMVGRKLGEDFRVQSGVFGRGAPEAAAAT